MRTRRGPGTRPGRSPSPFVAPQLDPEVRAARVLVDRVKAALPDEPPVDLDHEADRVPRWVGQLPIEPGLPLRQRRRPWGPVAPPGLHLDVVGQLPEMPQVLSFEGPQHDPLTSQHRALPLAPAPASPGRR